MGRHQINENDENEWVGFTVQYAESLIDEGFSVRDALLYTFEMACSIGHDIARNKYEAILTGLDDTRQWRAGFDKGYSLARTHYVPRKKQTVGNQRTSPRIESD